MKSIFKSIQVFLLFVLISKTDNAQDYNPYRVFDAAILRVDGDLQIESKLKKVIIALSNNSTVLTVKTTIPFYSTDNIPEDNTMPEAPGLLFSLKMNINLWQIQDYLTSAKVFNTAGVLTLNNTTRVVRVEYIPFPAGTDLDGNFNLTMIIQFEAGDFGLDVSHSNSKFIIKINDAKVNRV